MENELLYNELYEKTQDCGRAQFVKLLMEKERENQQLKSKLEASEKLIKIIENVNLHINDIIKTYEQKIDFEIDMGSEGEYKKIKCYEEFNRKLVNLKKELDIDKGE